MTSPIVACQAQISADWIAVVPEDRQTIRYHEISDRTPKTGTYADRGFFWTAPQREGAISSTGSADQVEWTIQAYIRLSAAGRGFTTLFAAGAHELQILVGVVESRVSWPAGVLDVQVEDQGQDIDEESGDVILGLTFRVLTEETTNYTYGAPIPPEGDPFWLDLESRLGAAETDIDTLESTVSDHEDRITALEDAPGGGGGAAIDYNVVELDRAFTGDGETALAYIGLVSGNFELRAVMRCDNSTSDAATITLKVVPEAGGAAIATVTTTSTTEVTVGPSAGTVATTGVYRIVGLTSAVTGVGYVRRVTLLEEPTP